MCKNKHWIRNIYGRSILVGCGHCPACLQEKAIARSNRIRNEHSDGKVCVFTTLTYRNNACPYFDLDELLAMVHQHDTNEAYGDSCLIDIKRDSRSYWFRSPHDGRIKRKTTFGTRVIDSMLFDIDFSRYGEFKFLSNQKLPKVGVCYYPDVQDFFKRLRQILKRSFNYDIPFSYFSCSEYGPRTCRPHFHVLFFISKGDYQVFKTAISKAWSFDDYHRTFNNTFIARDAAAYVASYVNSVASVPKVFSDSKQAKTKCSYSQGFGVALEHLSLCKVYEAYQRGDLTVNVQRLRKGTLVNDRVLLPKYVIHRYFPIIKGYCCLTSDEAQSVAFRPERLKFYAQRLGYTKEDLHVNIVRLKNKQKLFEANGISAYDFSLAYSRIYSLRASQVLKSLYSDIHCLTDNFTAYDNIESYFTGDVGSDSLDDVLNYLFSFGQFESWHPESDPNAFPKSLVKDQRLETAYYSYSKDRKVRNYIYNKLNKHM